LAGIILLGWLTFIGLTKTIETGGGDDKILHGMFQNVQ
jgi:hypothetical protein